MPLRCPTIGVPHFMEMLKNRSDKLKVFDVARCYWDSDKKKTSTDEFHAKQAEVSHVAFHKRRLPGAIAVRLDHLTLPTDPKRYEKYALSPPAHFQQYFQERHINKDDLVVVYCRDGYTSARLRWMLKANGMTNVFVLEGGMWEWLSQRGPTDSGTNKRGTQGEEFDIRYSRAPPGTWEASDQSADWSVGFDDLMRERVYGRDGKVNLVFCEWPWIDSDWIRANFPGSIILPISSFADWGKLHTAEQIQEQLHQVGYDFSKPAYTMCYDGSRSPWLGLALEKAGSSWKLFNGGFYGINRHKRLKKYKHLFHTVQEIEEEQEIVRP